MFGRVERVDNDELVVLPDAHDGPTYTVGKASIGVIRDLQLMPHVKIGVGALYALNFVPHAIAGRYGNGTPSGAMAFVRLKVE